MKEILLIGINGVYNYGCEAIIRGTVEILRNIDQSVHITYASYNYEDDKQRLADCDISIISRRKKSRWSFYNIIRKLLSFIGITYVIPYDSIGWVKKYDIVFSIGGDIYTLDSNNSFNPSLPLFLERCQRKGLKYILWGASVGKFEKNPKALDFYRKHLKKIDLIVVREKNSLDYLYTLGVVGNVVLAPDPAFFVPTSKELNSCFNKNFTIGLNLSPLSAMYTYGNLEEALRKQSIVVMKLINHLNCRMMFLPHVLGPDKLDNDAFYMKALYRNLPVEYQEKVSIVDTDPQFIGLKSFIKECNFVIAARMHCAINAITVGIPTIFLSYSEKAKGMSNYVYETDGAVMSLSEFENVELLIKTIHDWKNISRLNQIQMFNFEHLQILGK